MIPIIRDIDREFSGPCCPRPGGLKVLHKIHRRLPAQILQNNDPQVLQDESGAPFNDEITNAYIYDDLRAQDEPLQPVPIPEIFTLPDASPIPAECLP